MNTEKLIQVAVGFIGIVIIAAALGSQYLPVLGDMTPDPGGPDLVSVFAAGKDRSAARDDAKHFCNLCADLSAKLAYDGTRGENARIRTGQQLAQVRSEARDFEFFGRRLSKDYPAIGETLEKFLDDAAGKDGGKLSDEGRSKWVDAFKRIAAAAGYAAGRL